MPRRFLAILVLIGLPLIVLSSELSYLRPYGLQGGGWSLLFIHGQVSLAHWQAGRGPTFVQPPTDTVLVTIDPGSNLSRFLRGATRVVIRDSENNDVAQATVANLRRERVAEALPLAWSIRPYRPAIRTAVWLRVDAGHTHALEAARARGDISMGIQSQRRRGRAAGEVVVRHPETCGFRRTWQPVFRMEHYGVSMWLSVLCIAVICGLLCSGWLRRLLIAARRERHGMCLECAYDLRGSTLRCPECNAPFPTGAYLRRLRRVRWGFKVGLCACLWLGIAALGSSYFGATFQQGQTRVTLSGAALRLHALSGRVRTPSVYSHRLVLPRTYAFLPHVRIKPLRITLPLWIPMIGLVMMLYWLDIRPRRRRSPSAALAPPVPATTPTPGRALVPSPPGDSARVRRFISKTTLDSESGTAPRSTESAGPIEDARN